MPVTINVTQTLCRSVSCALVGSELSCKMSQVKVSTLSLYNCFSSFRLKFSTVKSNRLYLFFCREREKKLFKSNLQYCDYSSIRFYLLWSWGRKNLPLPTTCPATEYKECHATSMKLWAGFEDWLSCYSKILLIGIVNVSCSLIGLCQNSHTLHSYKYLYNVSLTGVCS
jgi:hypothetical protein